ncbi:MAG TPA: hypothetical protein VGH89_32640 [Pseudonocardia sp.]|jgi:hypothetical protein
MSARIQSICLWSGYSFFILYLVGIVVVAGFIPPPAPSWSGEAIAAYFQQRQGRILIGMSICAFASALYVPWGVAIFGEMLRMERTRFAPLSVVQVISAGVGAVFFAISPLMWLTLAYRAGHGSDAIWILNDFAWISWIVSWPFFFVQAGALGLCTLMHPSAALPRWVGYFSIWFGVSMFPASLIVFFDSGPFAWNGVFGIYLPLGMFALWYQVVSYYLRRAIKARAETAEPDLVQARGAAAPA